MPQDILRVLTHSIRRGPTPYFLYTIFDRKFSEIFFNKW